MFSDHTAEADCRKDCRRKPLAAIALDVESLRADPDRAGRISF